MKKLILSLFAIVLTGLMGNGYAQTTITIEEITVPFLSEGTSKIAADSAATVEMGAPGGNNTWDFSALEEQFVFDFQLIDVEDSPYADSFAVANAVTYFSFSDTSLGFASETWGYTLISDGSGDYEEGIHSLGGATLTDSEDGPITTFFRSIPGDFSFKTPLNFGDEWVSEDSVFTTTVFGEFSLGTGATSTVTRTVDAWGTMLLPGGESVEALRVKEVDVQEAAPFPGLPPSVFTDITYIFVGKNGETVSVGKDDGTAADTGSLTGFASYFNFDGNPTSGTNVEEPGLAEQGFRLEQNFPNPFTRESTITFMLDEAGPVALSVYDLLGREVDTLVNGFKAAGKHTLSYTPSELSGGVYLYKLTTPQGTQVRSMTVIQ